MSLVVGIDLGGTKTAAGLVDESGAVLARAEARTPASAGPRAVLDTAIHLAREVMVGRAFVRAVGIGAAGVVDPETRTVRSATDALPGWAGTRLGEELERALALPVATMNDVHAHAAGEAWLGGGRGKGTMLMVAAGTGIGGAWVIDGAVQLGANHVSGHIGHVPSPEATGLTCTCGAVGHLEVIASGPAIHAAYLRRGGDRVVADSRAVVDLAEAFDTHARDVVATAARALGRVIGGFMNALDPDVVVVSGGLASAGELWWSALRAGVSAEAMPIVAACPLVPAVLGADGAILGAARAAFARTTESEE
jgi:glucokinase